MKAFIFCLALLILLSALMLFHMRSIHKTLDSLTELVEKLPSDINTLNESSQNYLPIVEELYSLWDKKINKISYTIDYNRIDSVDKAIIELHEAYHSGAFEDFLRAKSLLLDALKRIHSLESISFSSIF